MNPLARVPASVRQGSIYAILALIFLTFITLARQSYQNIDRELTDSALSRRLSLAQLAAATLSEKLDGLIQLGISLATRVRMRELIAAGKWIEAGQILSSVLEDFPFLERLFLADVQGTQMFDIPELPGGRGTNFAYREWYKGVSANWEPYISPVYRRAAHPQRNVFAVAVPIKHEGRVIGILLMQARLEWFFAWARGLEIGPGGFVYVVDSKGQVAFHPRYDPQGGIIDFSKVPVVAKTLQGETGVELTYNPVEDEEGVSAYAPVKYGWGVIAQQPAVSAFAVKERQLQRILIGYVLILLFCIVVVWLTVRMFNQRRQAEAHRLVKDELERSVSERTWELEMTNRDLESFSYSVSHDLRAPLRAIEGYSTIIEEDYGDRLDAEGRRLFAVVRDNSKRMSLLIDDLLAFSRLGRQAIRPVDLNMDALARAIFEELQSQPGARPARLIAQPLPRARADPMLLRQVWTNLLANALKYSGKREQPVIELRGRADAAEVMYYVKDNGAGFDMQYYDKLFSVFQRLHNSEEYSGTGIGLAIVHRVITRHGGHVWAEGKVDEGATFYFTLPAGEGNEQRH